MKKLSVNMVGSGGIAAGRLHVVEKHRKSISPKLIANEEKEAEVSRFFGAFCTSENQLSDLAQSSEIFAAHLEILRDPVLSESVVDKIECENKNAEYALEETGNELSLLFESVDDEYIRARAVDVSDVCLRILQQLQGEDENPFAGLNEDVIVVADELLPSDTALMDFSRVRGLITRLGGVTSHVCIIARSKGIPAIVGLGDCFSDLSGANYGIIDGEKNEIILDPDTETIEFYQDKLRSQQKQKEQANHSLPLETRTNDGYSIALYANAGSVEEVASAISCGACGIGLFRSEFLFMLGRNRFPDEECQFRVYRDATLACKGRSITIRTLDIGGDKSLPYFPIHGEDNPFLGWRALRISLERKDIFRIQLRALLRASAFGALKIMFPMIISVEEFMDAKALVEKCKEELREEGKSFNEKIEIGMMIETPAAVFMAEDLAREADFFSIGTNDLVQYILAVDRLNEKVSRLYNPFHPAVLRSIKMVTQAASKQAKPVGICGELAGDSQAVMLLIGLGLTSLSMSAGSLSEISEQVSFISYKHAKAKAVEVCRAGTSEQVNALLHERIK